MSCVVGFKNKETGQLFFGADSISIDTESLFTRERRDEKVFIKDNILFGIVGSCRIGQVLRYVFTIPTKPEGMSDMEYLCSIFVRDLINCFKDNDSIQFENSEARFGGEIMVGFNKEIYIISSDFQVMLETEEFRVIGCAECFAQGSFYALKELDIDLDIEKMLLIALKCAAEYSAGVKGPFRIISLKPETNFVPTSKS